MEAVMDQKAVGPISVGFHYGNIIKYLSQAYGDGFLVIREAVQNSIDKGACSIYVRVDCARAIIEVYDNGVGAGFAEISKKFENIGLSLKLDDPTLSGEKGIGNLAGLAIAREWQLMTRDQANASDRYKLYSFQRAELQKSDSVNVHTEEAPKYKSLPGAPFTAYTMLRLLDVDELPLRQIGDSVVLSRTLTDAFGPKLKHRRIELRVSYKDFKGKSRDFLVKPPMYRGVVIEPEKYDTDFGEVEFAFFHSPRPLDDPKVIVQHQGVYGVPLSNFFALKLIDRSVKELFEKGYFEGEIRLGFCELNSSRSAFVPDAQLKSFVGAVEAFANEILRPLVHQLEQEGRENKHKKIADSLVKRMRDYFGKHYSLLPPALKTLISGGEQKVNTETGGNTPKKTAGQKKTEIPPKKREPLPPDAFKKQRARSKTGTSGEKRELKVTIGEGFSLRMVYPSAEEGFGWHSRFNDGAVEINTANASFLDAERRGQTKLSEYMFLLLQKELTCASLPPIDARTFSSAFEKSFMAFWRASFD